jgi:hypothetical protein
VGAKLKDPEQLAGGAAAGVSYLRNGWAADGAAFPRLTIIRKLKLPRFDPVAKAAQS